MLSTSYYKTHFLTRPSRVTTGHSFLWYETCAFIKGPLLLHFSACVMCPPSAAELWLTITVTALCCSRQTAITGSECAFEKCRCKRSPCVCAKHCCSSSKGRGLRAATPLEQMRAAYSPHLFAACAFHKYTLMLNCRCVPKQVCCSSEAFSTEHSWPSTVDAAGTGPLTLQHMCNISIDL